MTRLSTTGPGTEDALSSCEFCPSPTPEPQGLSCHRIIPVCLYPPHTHPSPRTPPHTTGGCGRLKENPGRLAARGWSVGHCDPRPRGLLMLDHGKMGRGGMGRGNSSLPSILCPSLGLSLQKSLRNEFLPWEGQVCWAGHSHHTMLPFPGSSPHH